MSARNTDIRLAVSLGLTQTVAWASSYYIPAILARPMADDLNCHVSNIYADFSIALVLAALTAPFAGKCVDKWGGKRILAASNIWFALSLLFLSQAQSEAGLFLGWASLGFAMGAGLYDMAFATVVQSRGPASAAIIAGITLLAGFASTVGWPISYYILVHFGWRQVLVIWACAHIFLALPLNLSLVLPMKLPSPKDPETERNSLHEPGKKKTLVIFVLALAFACASFCSVGMASHLPGLLQFFGVSAAVSILVGMTFGPAQVSARVLHLSVLRKMQPINTAILAAFIMPLGAVSLVLLGTKAALLVGLTHGFGNGIMTIIKGTLPLSIFGEKGYGRRQGLLFLPAGIVQAFSPVMFSLCIDRLGKDALYIYIATIWVTALLFLWLKRILWP